MSAWPRWPCGRMFSSGLTESRIGFLGEMKMKKSAPKTIKPAAKLIDGQIKALGDWRGEMLGRLRALIHAADPQVLEEWKWEVPVWSHDGIICTGESYKKAV